MPAVSWPALGVTIAVDMASPPTGTYTLIGQVKSIKGSGGGEVGARDTTTLASTVKSEAPTIPDNGECTVEVNFDPTDTVHKFLRADKDAPPAACLRMFKATYPTTPTPTATTVFPAYVKSFDGVDADGPDDNLTASFTLKVVGAVTNTP